MDDMQKMKMQEGRRVAATRRNGAVNCNRLMRSRRKEGQISNQRYSIQNFCRECQGFDPGDSNSLSAAVQECSAVECWLWPWRLGSLSLDDPSALEG